MFDRDTEVARNSAVSFNNEDEAEELALARLEAELRALEVEEEALAREEVPPWRWSLPPLPAPAPPPRKRRHETLQDSPLP